ncbi:MAG TPA: helical backbone metal receptor [Thermoanaerobaculia bacterium]|nr:helical backbone metal receptor [Thermoanaerobaculia bacterium]
MTRTRSRWLGPPFAPPARRLVSLVPSLTEAVFELGAGGLLVGRTGFCTRPTGAVEAVPAVGGTKDPDLERIAALAPDLVLANREENSRARVERIAERTPVLLTDPHSPADVPILWRELGSVLGRETVAAALASEVEAALLLSRPEPNAPAPRFVCWIWRDPWMAAGPKTYLSELLCHAGLANAVPAATARYPRLSPAEALALGADLHLFLSEPYDFRLPRDLADFARPAEPEGDAWRLDRGPLAQRADGELLAWYPARTAEGLRYAAALRSAGSGPRAL